MENRIPTIEDINNFNTLYMDPDEVQALRDWILSGHTQSGFDEEIAINYPHIIEWLFENGFDVKKPDFRLNSFLIDPGDDIPECEFCVSNFYHYFPRNHDDYINLKKSLVNPDQEDVTDGSYQEFAGDILFLVHQSLIGNFPNQEILDVWNSIAEIVEVEDDQLIYDIAILKNENVSEEDFVKIGKLVDWWYLESGEKID